MRANLPTPLGSVALYLLATLPLMGVGAARGGGGAVGVLVLHALALAAALGWLRRRGHPEPWSSALALAAIPLLYAQVPWLNQALAAGFRDPLVAGWEVTLFGFDPSRELAGMLPWRWLSEPLHLVYASFYPGIYVPPLLLALRRRHAELTTTTLGVLLAAVACYLAFDVFPVQGPRYFGPPEGVPDGPVRGMVLLILEGGSSRGAAFPSAHVAVMAAQTLLALRFQRRVGLVLAACTAGVGVGAVYGGFHYAVDVVAGAAVGAAAAWGALRLRRGAAVEGRVAAG